MGCRVHGIFNCTLFLAFAVCTGGLLTWSQSFCCCFYWFALCFCSLHLQRRSSCSSFLLCWLFAWIIDTKWIKFFISAHRRPHFTYQYVVAEIMLVFSCAFSCAFLFDVFVSFFVRFFPVILPIARFLLVFFSFAFPHRQLPNSCLVFGIANQLRLLFIHTLIHPIYNTFKLRVLTFSAIFIWRFAPRTQRDAPRMSRNWLLSVAVRPLSTETATI